MTTLLSSRFAQDFCLSKKTFMRAFRLGLAATLISQHNVCLAQTQYLYSLAPTPSSNPTSVDYGYVEQADGHLHLEIPIGEPRQNRSGSGKTQVRLVYDSNLWSPNYLGASYSWLPGGGWSLLPTGTSYNYHGDPLNPFYQSIDTNGVPHNFPCRDGCYSTDGKGYYAATPGTYNSDGSQVVSNFYQATHLETIIDPNGNSITMQNGYGVLPNVYGQQSGVVYFDTSNIQYFYDYSSGSDTYLYAPNMSSAGTNATYVTHQVAIKLNSAFHMTRVPVAECVNSGANICGAAVLSQITLPDQTAFTFKYDCDSTISAQQSYCTSPGGQLAYYGGLTEMVTPTGQKYTYSYAPFFDAHNDASLGLQTRSNGEGVWSYSQAVVSICPNATDVGCQQTLTEVEPNGRKKITTNVLNNGAWPVSELVTDSAGNRLALKTTQWDFSHHDDWMGYGSAYVQKQSETDTEWDTSGAAQTKRTAYTYDSAQTGNIAKLQQWGFYPGTSPSFPSVADVTTYMSYYHPANSPMADVSPFPPKGGTNVISKPTTITVCNSTGNDPACPGGGSRVSQKIIYYDQYGSSGLTSVTGVTSHNDSSHGSSQQVRGNPTTVLQWVSGGQYISQSMTYDTTGQVTSVTDGNGNVTLYDYTDNYFTDNGTSVPSAYLSSAPTHAYASTVTLPPVNGRTYIKQTGYYYGNQKPAFSTDINGNTTYYHYGDALDRLTQTVYPLGWSLMQYTSSTRRDGYRSLLSLTPSNSCSDCIHTSTVYDGLGRASHTTSADGSVVDLTYNSMGQVQSVSNPYRSLSELTSGNTAYVYDVWGRVCVRSNPDNTLGIPTSCSSNGNSTQSYSYVVNGGYKTDEVGNRWAYSYDGLGHLSSVAEPIGHTQYGYDILGNLQNVVQGGAVDGTMPVIRSFTYDGLSRLVTSTNPEAGTMCFGSWSGGSAGVGTCQNGYDPNGNLLYKTDARGVVLSYTYDAWNRLTQKITPIVLDALGHTSGYTATCYQYDSIAGAPPTGANLAGHLVAEWTQSGSQCASSYIPSLALTAKVVLTYDVMGRPLLSQQCIKTMCTSQPFVQSQTYDLAGNNISWQDGLAQMTFSLPFDTSNHPASLTNTYSPNGLPSTIFTAQGFSSFGALQNWNVGNLLNFSRTFDNRGRPTGETVTH